MADPPYIAIELMLLESNGAFFTVGEPRLLCWFKAVHLPGTQLDEGKVCVVARDGVTSSWREHTRPVMIDQSREVVARLVALGIPHRTLDTKGVVDTSDGWTHLLLRVRADERTMALDIDMQSSGFDGTDAEPLRALFRHLFALAGYEGFSPVVYGSRPTKRST